MNTIFVFGDSITYGAWDLQHSGWTALLRKHLDSSRQYPAYYFYPLGIPGETSNGLRKRFQQEFESRRRSDDQSYTCIFACGANDATWLTNERKFKVPIEEYEDNMGYVLTKAKKLAGRVLVLNTTPVNELNSREFKGKDKSCLNEYVDKYNDAIKRVSDAQGVELIDVNSAFKQRDSQVLLNEDGLHPNSDGHETIFETVKKALL